MKLSKENLEKYVSFDETAEKADGYVDKTAKSPDYHIRNMHKWCVANHRDNQNLTPNEREKFRSPDLSEKVRPFRGAFLLSGTIKPRRRERCS